MEILSITENGYGKRTDMDEYIRADGPQKRGGFGLKGYNVTEKTGPVVGVKVVSDGDDVLVIRRCRRDDPHGGRRHLHLRPHRAGRQDYEFGGGGQGDLLRPYRPRGGRGGR